MAVVDKKLVVPEFGYGSVPISVAVKVFGKDACWIRAGIIAGWLPIGIATRGYEIVKDVDEINSSFGRIAYYISPRKLWELTGYVWKGKGGASDPVTAEQQESFIENIREGLNEYLERRNV